MTPAAVLPLEQRLLGCLFDAVDRGDLPAFLEAVTPHTPGPLARWITDPVLRVVASTVDDLLADGATPDAMSVASKLLATDPTGEVSATQQHNHQAAELAATDLIQYGSRQADVVSSTARAIRDAHDRRELLEALRWTAGELKAGEDLATLRDLLGEKLRDAARPTIKGFGDTSAASLIEDHGHMRPPLIEGLLRTGEVMNLVAAPKVGKSWLGLGLALSVATGAAWLGMETHQKRVLYVDNELHPETWASRAHLVAAQMHAQDGLHAIFPVLLRGQVKSLPDMESSICEAAGRHTCGLIILDALYRMLPMDASENDNAAMTQLFNCLDRIASATGCCVVVVHHSSKGSQGEKANTDVGAGAGALARATDCHLTLRPHEEDDLISVNVDVRSFPKVAPFVITRANGVVWTVRADADPEKIKGRRIDRQAAASVSAEQILERFLPQKPATVDEILETARAAGVAVTRGRMKGILDLAVRDGKASRQSWLHGSSRYGREVDGEPGSVYDRVRQYLTEHPEATTEAVAVALHCDPTSVRRARKKLESA